MKTIKELIRNKVYDLKKKLTGISAEPRKIAMGYAFGIFLAATPLIGIKVFIAIAVTFLFKWNKTAAIIGVFHINPLTGPVFYGFSYLVGKYVLGADIAYDFVWPVTIRTLCDILTSNSLVFMSLLTGGFILGLPMAIAAYYFTHSIILHKPIIKTNAI